MTETKQKLVIYFIIILSILIGLVLIFVINFGGVLFSGNYFLSALIYSVSGGIIGGSIYMGRGFYQSVAEIVEESRKFDFNRWIWWYLLRPLLSGLAGGLLFLIIYIAFDLQESSKNQIAFFIFGILAGYNFHDFVSNKLGLISTTIFSKDKKYDSG